MSDIVSNSNFQLLAGISSILGFLFSLFTLIVSSRVNSKVNNALRFKEDTDFFSKKCQNNYDNLKGIQESIAKNDKFYNLTVSCKIINAITLVENYVHIIYKYDNIIKRHVNIHKCKNNIINVRNIISKNKLEPEDLTKLNGLLSFFILIFERESNNG